MSRQFFTITLLIFMAAIMAVGQIAYAQAPDTLWTKTYRVMAVDNAGNKGGFLNEVNTTSALSLQQDSLALLALYDSTSGDNWTNNTNWLTGQPLSNWYGITVSGGRVTVVYLENNNLVGTIPSEIGNMTNLQDLSLTDNQLSGSIPTEIDNLVNLQILNLHVNQLTGSIPSEIDNLTNLTSLNLSSNQLSGSIPTEIWNLTNLVHLDLSSNQLTGSIPPEIGNLENLELLRLIGIQLTGSIPTEIGNLMNLTHIDLHGNQLTGAIPPEVGNLTNLTFLDFGGNQLSGSIPPEIGNLTNLHGLLLSENQLTGSIPTEIGNLTNLWGLHLNDNQLTGSIPTEIGNLTNLRGQMNFCTNQLTGSIPPEIGNLTNLGHLDLQNNQLTGSIPPEIGNLMNLENLDLSINQLTGPIPTEIGYLTNLNNLTLSSNQLTGVVPHTITGLTELVRLYLHENKLIDLPNLLPLDSLYELKIENNRFTFEDIEPNIGVPSETFTYSPQDSVGTEQDTTVTPGSSLTVSVSVGGEHNQYQWKKDGTTIGTQSSDSSYIIDPVDFADAGAYTCEITNTVATELTLYSRPLNLTVEYSPLQQDSLALIAFYDSTNGDNWTNNTNWKTGQPLSNWYGITVSGGRVTEVNLGTNNLVGTIPPEIGNLDSLQYLDLWDNQLSGSIPSSIVNLTNLKEFELFNNQLTGSIPDEIGNLLNLNTLLLDRNQLSGSIPSTIGNLTKLNRLHIGNNQLTGSIPPELGNLTNLTEDFVFGNNNLSGEIPPELGNLTNLQVLDLSNNQFTGSISTEIGYLTNLNHLDFGDNQLSGSIPTQIGNLNNLRNLDLSGNQLTGSIPTSIGNLTNLQGLVLYHNQLTDSIPSEIGNLTNLTYLGINSNQLTGSIPSQISNLTNLTELWLECNQLSGTIPNEIGNLTQLQHLSLFGNQLSDSIPIEIGNLTNLGFLNLSCNQLTGSIPQEIGNLTNLTYLHLGINQLTGAIPDSIVNSTNLTQLYLYDNEFIDLSDLSPIDSLKNLKIENNKFTFEDIEPNIGVPSEEFTYSPQDSVGTEQDTTVTPGSSLTISVTIGGANNQYQWKKDGTNIGTQNSDSSYTIDPVDFPDAGAYTCEITNTVATELTLYSRPMNVTVIDTAAPAVPENLTANPGNKQVILRWNRNTESDLHKYNIYRDTSSPATSLVDSVVGSTPDTFYTDTGLTNGQTYYYRITAVDSAGNESGYSNEVIATLYGGPVWHVSTTGSDETGDGSEENPFTTIQYGIDVASARDTILVQPGTYVENINFNGKNIVVGSLTLITGDTLYISQTVIDGNQNGSVITFENGEDSTAVLSCLTIINGLNESGGGIYCNNISNPTITQCYIIHNLAKGSGGGIVCHTSSPIIKNCYIGWNRTQGLTESGEGFGGGVNCEEASNPTIISCTIVGNQAEPGLGGGINCWFNSSPLIINCMISDNSSYNGGGINCESVSISKIINCLITRNSGYGAGIRCYGGAKPLVQNCTLYSNVGWGSIASVVSAYPTIVNSIIVGGSEGGISFDGESSASVSHCDFYNNKGGDFIGEYIPTGLGEITTTNNNGDPSDIFNNIFLAPLFLNTDNGDFHLQFGSPCIDSGDPDLDNDGITWENDSDDQDPDSTRMDMGAFYFSQDFSQTTISSIPEMQSILTQSDTILIEFADPFDPGSVYHNIKVNSIGYGGFPVDVFLGTDNKTIYIRPLQSYPFFDTVRVIIKPGITNIEGLLFDYDGDKILTDYNLIYYTSLLGDYNIDFIVNFDDFITFRDTWWEQENIDITPYELHPLQGQIPNVLVQPDGIFAYDELMTFIYMWNWSHDHGGFLSRSPIAKTTSAENRINFIPRYSENDPWRVGSSIPVDLEVILNNPSEVSAIELVLIYNSDQLSYKNIEYSELPDCENNQWVNLNYNEVESGQLVIDMASFSKEHLLPEGKNLLNFIEFDIVETDSTDIGYYYDIRYYDGSSVKREVTSGNYVLHMTKPLPESYELKHNYPNPFNTCTTIRYALPKKSRVSIIIYDVLGRRVTTLVDNIEEPGYKSVVWDATNDIGQQMSAGVYIYLIKAGEFSRTRKMILLK